MYHSFTKVDQGPPLYLGVIQQCMYETIHSVDDLRKRLMQTWLTLIRTLSMLRLACGVTVWDHACMLVVDTLNTWWDMNVHLC